jgi:hypothetical protein
LGGGRRGGGGGCEISRHGDGEIYIEKLINPLSGVTEVMLSGLPRILHRAFLHVDFIALHLRWFLWWVVVPFVMVPTSLVRLKFHGGRGIFSFPLPFALVFMFLWVSNPCCIFLSALPSCCCVGKGGGQGVWGVDGGCHKGD